MKKDLLPLNSVANVRFLSPAYALLSSVFLFFAILIILPVSVKIPLTGTAMLFWFVCFFSFLGGTLFGAGNQYCIPSNSNDANQISNIKQKKSNVRLLIFIVAIGFIGSILLLIDRYGLREVSFTADAMASREVLAESSSSIISMVAAFASSIGVLSYMLIWLVELNKISVRLWVKFIAILNILTVILVSVQLGSRSLLLVILLSHMLVWFFVSRVSGNKLKKLHMFIVFILLSCMTVLSALLIIMRVNLMGFSMLDSILISSYAEIIEPSEFVLDLLQNENILTVLIAGIFSLVQYVFHGIYEFSLLFNDFDGDHEMGYRTFWLPLKAFSTLTNGSISVGEFSNSGIREGIFTTYVGPVFIDFGLFSPLILFVNGILFGLPFRWLVQGKLAWLPLVALFSTGAILWPVVNIFESSSGTFLLVGSIVIGLFGKSFRLNAIYLNNVSKQ